MTKINKDNIDKFYDYDIHIETRTIYMGSIHTYDDGGESGTDAMMAERIIKGLHLLESMSPSGDKPIIIIMNNLGGNEYHGMAIFDAIRLCKNHVTVKVFGHAMSMGSIILQAADQRCMTKNSRIMIHYGTWGTVDHPKIVYSWAEEGKKFDRWMEKLYLEKIKEKNPTFNINRVKKMCSFDTFLNAEESLELGLIDEILE